MSEPRTCEECKWCLLQEYGYSSYTVEGTYVYCTKSLHPSGPEGFDRWYREDGRLNFAQECSGFTEGESVQVDVDRDNVPFGREAVDDPWFHFYTEDEEQRAQIAVWEVTQ